MHSNNEILKQRQCAMRREMDRRGIALKSLSFDSGIPYSSLVGYFPQEGASEPSIMSAAAVFALTGHLPADILSLLLPTGHLIVRAPEQIDHDAAAEAFHDYLTTKERAHHPDSEAGREIGPGECTVLRGKFTAATKVAA